VVELPPALPQSTPPGPTQSYRRDDGDEEIHNKGRTMKTAEKPNADLSELQSIFKVHTDEQAGPGHCFDSGGDGEYFTNLHVT